MKYLFLICVLFGAYKFYDSRHVTLADGTHVAGQELPVPPMDKNVVMYSLTTCGYCVEKAKELARHQIAHVEYFMDEDPQSEKEFSAAIRNAGMPIKPYGTPVFVIYDEVLPNNPSIELIKATIAKQKKLRSL